MPDGGDPQRGGGQSLLSRRQILTGTSIGIGATLLFHSTARHRIDVPAPGPRPPGVAPAPPAAGGTHTVPLEDTGSGGRDTRTADGDAAAEPTPDRPAIHRSKLAERGTPRAVARGDAGVLVIGASDDGEPVGWLTEDGRQWMQHTFGTTGGRIADVWGVAPFVGDFVAVGATIERETHRIAEPGLVPGEHAQVKFTAERRSPTVWRTSDGASWTGQSFDDIGGPQATLTAVASNGTRLVAVGSVLGEDGASGMRGLVLVSDDGASWRPADVEGADALVEGSFTAVSASDDGWYATSSDIDGGAVWRSSDGWRWSVVEASREAFRRMALQGVGVVDDRVLVAGTGLFDPEPRYFVSRTGGRSWRRARLDVSLLAGRKALVGDLTVIAGDVVVVGTRGGSPVLEGGELHGLD